MTGIVVSSVVGRPLPLRSLAGLLASILLAGPVQGQETMHEVIDRLIAARHPDFAARCATTSDDDEFVRRVHLDLVGTLPAAGDLRAFRDDPDPEKRVALVDRLLETPSHARHLQRVVDVWLMRRLPAKHVPAEEWQTFLRESFARNDGWDDIVRTILSADGVDPNARGPARFYLDREGETNTITRDVASVFLGVDVQCAQCHDHPEIDDVLQRHYHGLSAFFVRSFLFTDPTLKKAVLAEKAEGEVTFKSVFVAEAKDASTPPRLFDGEPLGDPMLEEGKEYTVAPAKDVRPIPVYSRRSELPELLATTANSRFARTAVNRFWSEMFGRGLVDPVDADHAGNPPSHPELLDRLAAEFAGREFDVRWLLREIVLSETYQRGSRLPEAPGEPLPEDAYAVALVRPLSAEQLANALLVATGEAEIQRGAAHVSVKSAAKTENLELDAAARTVRIEAECVQRSAAFVNRFVTLLGGPPGEPPEEFEARVDQALFLMNDPLILGTLSPREGNLVARLLAVPGDEHETLARELYESVLLRVPTPEETAEVRDYVASAAGEDRTRVLGELVWALVTSAEFRFVH